MLKNSPGRPLKNPDVKQEIVKLRITGHSFTEIVKKVEGVNSRQVARYHYLTAVGDKVFDKKMKQYYRRKRGK